MVSVTPLESASATPGSRGPRALVVALAPALVGVAVILNAARGLMPGVGYWDTGEFQTVLPILGTAHPTGYPTYVLLGFVANILLAPFGEPAFRITLLSLVAVAAAAATTVALVRHLTGSTAIGVASGLGLALTPVVWANATRADPHPLHLALVAVLLLTLVIWERRQRHADPRADRWLVAAAVVFGLSMGNHSLTLLLAPPIALFVLATEPRIVLRPRLLATCAIALIGSVAAVYLELPIRSGLFPAPLVYAQPNTWNGFWYIALAEQFRGSLSDPLGDLPAKLGVIGQFAWDQFGPLAVLIPFGFLAAIRTVPRYALLTGSAMVLTVLFNASYANADIARYYLGPVLWAWTWLGILAGVVVERILELAPALGDGTVPLTSGSRLRVSTTTVVAGVVALGLLAPPIAASPVSRARADRSSDTSADRWLAQTIPALAPNAVIVSWWSTSTPLWYAQKIEGLRPDLFVVDDRTMLDLHLGGATDVIARYLGTRPVYVIRANQHDLGLVLDKFQLSPVLGDGSSTVYEVIGRTVVPG